MLGDGSLTILTDMNKNYKGLSQTSGNYFEIAHFYNLSVYLEGFIGKASLAIIQQLLVLPMAYGISIVFVRTNINDLILNNNIYRYLYKETEQ